MRVHCAAVPSERASCKSTSVPARAVPASRRTRNCWRVAPVPVQPRLASCRVSTRPSSSSTASLGCRSLRFHSHPGEPSCVRTRRAVASSPLAAALPTPLRSSPAVAGRTHRRSHLATHDPNGGWAIFPSSRLTNRRGSESFQDSRSPAGDWRRENSRNSGKKSRPTPLSKCGERCARQVQVASGKGARSCFCDECFWWFRWCWD